MVMCFLVRLANPIQFASFSLGGGIPSIFFRPYFIENLEENREPSESLNNQHFGVRSLQISIECGLKQYYNQLWSDNIGESE